VGVGVVVCVDFPAFHVSFFVRFVHSLIRLLFLSLHFDPLLVTNNDELWVGYSGLIESPINADEMNISMILYFTT
jgi:hypothetical protein